MVNYKNSKIYKIVDNTTGNVYYGSTTKSRLCQRLSQHKCEYKQGKTYLSSHDILKNGDYDIVLVELYPCNNKDELHKRERYWIENNECVNKNIPAQTKKERRDVKSKLQLKYYYRDREEISFKKKKLYAYEITWGGNINSYNNNLLRIEMDLFK